MPEPTSPDDPWADLYADLGVTERPRLNYSSPPLETTTELAEGDESPEIDHEGGLNGSDGDEDSDEKDETGQPKKRRRRRRRRGSKRPNEGTQTSGEFGAESPVDSATDTESGEADVDDELGFGQEDAGDSSELDPAENEEPASVEGATSEMTRELIANWNVPSWEEIVAGLYRPER